jgi:hypothetical protein
MYFVKRTNKGKGKGRSVGPIQHGSLRVDCTLAPEIVPSFISRGAPHQAVREASTSEGRKLNTRIFSAPRNLLQVLGSFTCPKFGTWGRLFNFPSKGRHLKNPTASAGFEPEASMLTTRPPKPSKGQIKRVFLEDYQYWRFLVPENIISKYHVKYYYPT